MFDFPHIALFFQLCLPLKKTLIVPKKANDRINPDNVKGMFLISLGRKIVSLNTLPKICYHTLL